MDKNSKIYIAGHRGMVGSAIERKFRSNGFNNLLTRTHSELDLCDPVKVKEFFDDEKPDYVVIAAAKVGGIMANSSSPVEFLLQNIAIQDNVITEAWKHNVKKLCFLGSSCIYPAAAPQPGSGGGRADAGGQADPAEAGAASGKRQCVAAGGAAGGGGDHPLPPAGQSAAAAGEGDRGS